MGEWVNGGMGEWVNGGMEQNNLGVNNVDAFLDKMDGFSDKIIYLDPNEGELPAPPIENPNPTPEPMECTKKHKSHRPTRAKTRGMKRGQENQRNVVKILNKLRKDENNQSNNTNNN